MNNGEKWVAILNAVSITGFVVLAIVFNHWWIALFSYFFLFKYTKD